MSRVRMIRIIVLRAAMAAALFVVVFLGGFTYRDARLALEHPRLLPAVARLIPEQIELAMHDAAFADTAALDPSPLEVYDDALQTAQNEYYGRTGSTRDLTFSAIRGMMGSLGDRYTRFLDPKEYADMVEDNEGEFVGIGAQLGTNAHGQCEIVQPLPNSPALRAHLRAGDVILEVNHKSVARMDLTDVVKLIRGAAHTPVVLMIHRAGLAKPLSVTIVREYIQQEVVVSEMVDPVHKIGYIALAQFNEESDPQIGKAMTRLQSQGMRALILDLRGNPGGLLNAAQDIASRFLLGGPVVWEKERGGEVHALYVEPKQHDHPRYPLAVLVNGGSASAAEITSGAIKDDRMGELIGERTFGKGLVQTVIPLPDRSAVAITTAHYYTPLKHDINHKGILPNIVVPLTRQAEEKMNSYATTHQAAVVDVEYDPQLDRGIQYLIAQERSGARPQPW